MLSSAESPEIVSVWKAGASKVSSTDYTFTSSGKVGTLTINKAYLETLGIGDHSFSVQLYIDNKATTISHAFTIAVAEKNAVAINITANKTTNVQYGDSATYTARISAGDSTVTETPTGTVQFKVDGGNYGAPIALVNGSATVTVNNTALTYGTHEIVAEYSGDDEFDIGQSSVTTTVAKRAATIGLKDQKIYVGDSLPTFTLHYDNIVGGDSLSPQAAAVFGGVPANANNIGTYSVTWDNMQQLKNEIEALAVAENYTITYVSSAYLYIQAKPSDAGNGNNGWAGTVNTSSPPTAATLTPSQQPSQSTQPPQPAQSTQTAKPTKQPSATIPSSGIKTQTDGITTTVTITAGSITAAADKASETVKVKAPVSDKSTKIIVDIPKQSILHLSNKKLSLIIDTPISNSMSEMFVMQRFLQPQALKKRGLHYFDSWAATFCEVVSSLEITPEGSG